MSINATPGSLTQTTWNPLRPVTCEQRLTRYRFLSWIQWRYRLLLLAFVLNGFGLFFFVLTMSDAWCKCHLTASCGGKVTVADWPTILIFCSYWLVAAWHTIGWHIVSSYFIGPMVVALVNYALGTRDFTMLCKIPVGTAYIREHS